MFMYNPATKTNTYIPMSHSHTTQHTSTSTGTCQDDWGCNTCSTWWVIGWVIIFIAASIFMWAIIREAF